MPAMPVETTAAVLHDYNASFSLESLSLDGPGPGEVLVRVCATGICHTDIKVGRGYAGVPMPVVLGHEGSGTVEAVGNGVTGLVPGDHVILTFPSCGHCRPCREHHPAYCDQGQALSFSCSKQGYGNVHGHFFGQSSFAGFALATAGNMVKVDRALPLENLGPLGCGFQTGAGIILNVLQPPPGRSLAVFGTGNVGLSAIMAARIAGLDPVIAVDTNPGRLDLARQLGASHVIRTGEGIDAGQAILEVCSRGVDFAVDTTNAPAVVRQAFESLANRGTCVHSGGGGKDLTFPGSGLLHGRTVTGVIQGDSVPQIFIPRLLAYHRDGQFPFDRLLTFYSLAQINQAITDMEQGIVVKPVLRITGA